MWEMLDICRPEGMVLVRRVKGQHAQIKHSTAHHYHHRACLGTKAIPIIHSFHPSPIPTHPSPFTPSPPHPTPTPPDSHPHPALPTYYSLLTLNLHCSDPGLWVFFHHSLHQFLRLPRQISPPTFVPFWLLGTHFLADFGASCAPKGGGSHE